MIDERTETFALHLACVLGSAFTAFVLGMWARTGSTDPAAVVGVVLVWVVLAFGWFSHRPRRDPA